MKQAEASRICADRMRGSSARLFCSRRRCRFRFGRCVPTRTLPKERPALKPSPLVSSPLSALRCFCHRTQERRCRLRIV
jgi:hypothetical protein